MFIFFKLLLSLGTAVTAFLLWRLFAILTRPYKSTLRNLPGPPPLHWLYGHLREFSSYDNALHEIWIEMYGITTKYKGLLGSDTLLTTDTRAISRIINRTDIYQKSDYNRFLTSIVLGNNIVTLEGEEHRWQVRDIWISRISGGGKDTARIDTYSELLKVTLDVIGLAGFNYDFKSLSSSEQVDSLHKAYSDLRRQSISGLKIYLISWYLFPLLRKPSAVQRATDKAISEMRMIGTRLLADMKRDVMEAQKAQAAHTIRLDDNATPDALQNRALLTLLVQANTRTDLPESQRLSDNDVIDRDFLVAGHETTSNATAWSLHALSQAPEVQQKLRDELWALPSDNPTMDELQALPYLDMVVRETLRMYTPVPYIQRIATKDDVIPLETPVTDIHGKIHREIRMSKGTAVDVPILALNRSKHSC
ncbi:cytochrome P450 [Wolfiporia cocos MD-104 SS10]|uniref:Cytochrome P450 n=1 Tax=Wolfiporia cocos (strain MD-104) TaxID=742152 RepID=A0A2H3J4I2_WOLCO|nr:cytochrome P450 [Wolfiporia cocos MD-104 SS10]